MKYNYRLSQRIINCRKRAKMRENIKLGIVIALIAIIGNLTVFWAVNLWDRAYEERAAAAGYELPINQVRK